MNSCDIGKRFMLFAASVDWSMPYGYEYVGTAPAFVREDRKVRVGCF